MRSLRHKDLLGIADLTVEEIDRRINEYKIPEPLFERGVMAKYSKAVSSASLGAIT